MQGGQQHGKFVTAQSSYQIFFPQLCPDTIGHGHQHRIARRMAKAVVDFLEPVTVEKQHGHPLIQFMGVAHRALQTTFEKCPVRQACETVMVGLVSEGFVFALQVSLPRLEFIEQGIEVVAQIV
ncbi:hypothetical protein D3C71_778630 [compost metagenome]